MAEELGTWPAEQATVLLEVLQKAGLSPDAKRTRDGVLVTVPEDESDEAHRQLVANMDAIARAARQPKAGGQRPASRRPRPVKGADNGEDRSQQQLGSERMMRAAKPLGLILLAVLVLGTVGRFMGPVVGILLVGALVYLIGKRAQQQGGDDGSDGRL